MDKKRLYIDFHVLQTVPPSCVNRDDTGSPKTAVYGGTTRARVSSQAWKRAVRILFREGLLDPEQIGERTKKVVGMVEQEIKALAPEQDTPKLAKKAVENAGLKIAKGDNLDTLFFMSWTQARALADLIVSDCKDKSQYKEAIKLAPAADMVLFGRMVASDPSLNYDAAAQVAHAISTHAVQTEYDYFTAVDDCAPEDTSGAGHLGTIEFNSSTLYRYATVNAMELANHLDAQGTAAVVRAFAEAFICSMPTGKQNSFANRTLPDAVYVTVRCDQPVNLCGAFEKAVPASPNGFTEPSKQKLTDYAKQVYQYYTGAPQDAFTVGMGLEDLAPAMPLNDMLDALETAVRCHMDGNGVE